MSLVVYTKSRSFEGHINAVIDGEVSYRSTLSPPVAGPGNVYLVHGASFARELSGWLETAHKKGAVIAVAADNPQIEDLLAYSQLGVSGYFNAYMSAANYTQLLRLLGNAQSWFPADLLSQAFALARTAIQPISAENSTDDPLEKLTKREREVALAVAEGKSNKLVASACQMAERTVKTHLTQIFKKLEVKDRVALVIYLGQFDSIKQQKSSVR